MQLVSIIIPVYNVAPYLRRCLDSVVTQTYQNMEILLIDDGSTDESPAICDEYANRYVNIRVIHKPNGGVSSARNLGILESKGNYITFIDSDDMVAADMVQVMYDNAIQHNVLLSCCQLDVVEIDGTKRSLDKGRTGIYTKNEILQSYFSDQFIKDQMYGPFNKLYHRSLTDKFYFKPYKLGEDILFIFEVLQACDKVYIDSFIGYHYLHREGSAMTSVFSAKRLDYIHAGEEMLKISMIECPFVTPSIEKWLFSHIIVMLRQMHICGKVRNFHTFYKSKKKWLVTNRQLFGTLPSMRKLDYIALFICPLYFKIFNIVKK